MAHISGGLPQPEEAASSERRTTAPTACYLWPAPSTFLLRPSQNPLAAGGEGAGGEVPLTAHALAAAEANKAADDRGRVVRGRSSATNSRVS